ncbi:MAG: T9SS type A sorting domain-containing protein, partial [Candidatus Cloacimonetes bacterium]|nr:T9SS type A sorting domain-containing protein [Candidatus Cloacimonadota bacterium]
VCVEYTYWVTAVYSEGESEPSDTCTAIPHGVGPEPEFFYVNWHLTGWTTDPISPNNWAWSPGYAVLNWSPSVPNYDMSLISPQIILPNDTTYIYDLTISMYINDYSPDSSEVMEIWIIHDGQETIIFEWDLDLNDDWGSSGGTDWVFTDMDQFAGETIQLKFRSHGDDTYNFNYWYIYMIWLDFLYTPYYGSLQGIVTDNSGNPFENVSVHAETNGGYLCYNVLTNINGEYLIEPIMENTYDIIFKLDHYNVMVEEDIEIFSNQTTILDMIMTAPTMSISPTFIDTVMVPDDTLNVYLTISNDGDGPLDWHTNYNFKKSYKRNILNNNNSLPSEKPKLSNTLINHRSYVEECPYQTTSNYPPAKDTLDILFAYDVDTLSGLVGLVSAETDGNYLYTTKWNGSGEIAKFDIEGNFIEIFYIPGVINLRDLAYDGTYFYGSDASNYIWQMDFDTQTLVSTIPCPVAVRSIAYDEDNDAFWVNNWSDDLKLVDRSGNVLNTIYAPPSMYGSTYDNITFGGPYLWIFTGTTTGDGCQVEQYDLNTLALTGVTHSVSGDFPGTIAGGLFTSGDIVPGIWVLGGLAQGTPDILFGYELGFYENWIVLLEMSGTVEPGDSYDFPIQFNSSGQEIGTILSTEILITSEPDVGTITIPVTLTIIGSGVDDVPFISTKLNQNYPNPFNSSTTISFSLSHRKVEDTEIKIYNIKGQLINTLETHEGNSPQEGFATWNGKDMLSKDVANGIYFYKLSTKDKTFIKKMILIR